MTRRIKLSIGSENPSTAISNIFIDKYMADANGSYVKVYIYLLRCLGDPSMAFSVSTLSDRLDETEKDIIKALRYWEKKKLLGIAWDEDGQISGIEVNMLGTGVSNEDEEDEDSEAIALTSSTKKTAKTPADKVQKADSEPLKQPTVPSNVGQPAPVDISKPSYTAAQIAAFKEEYDEFNELVDYVQNLSGRLVSHADLQTCCFLFENLGMSIELIKYLYDYCSYKGKLSSAYIEKVAISWSEKEIDTVDKARAETIARTKECSAVKSAFGFSRALGAMELDYVDRWRLSFGMDAELIKEACGRALLSTGNPDFKYADRILLGWHNAEVKSKDDVAKLDSQHAQRSQLSRENQAKAQARHTQKPASGNNFTQFPHREHSESDYSEFEKKKLGIK